MERRALRSDSKLPLVYEGMNGCGYGAEVFENDIPYVTLSMGVASML